MIELLHVLKSRVHFYLFLPAAMAVDNVGQKCNCAFSFMWRWDKHSIILLLHMHFANAFVSNQIYENDGEIVGSHTNTHTFPVILLLFGYGHLMCLLFAAVDPDTWIGNRSVCQCGMTAILWSTNATQPQTRHANGGLQTGDHRPEIAETRLYEFDGLAIATAISSSVHDGLASNDQIKSMKNWKFSIKTIIAMRSGSDNVRGLRMGCAGVWY